MMGDFPFLEFLTRRYLNEAQKTITRNWILYLKAHGLANACIARDDIDARRKLVYDIEDSWYKGKHPQKYHQHQQMISKHQQLLQSYRRNTKLELASLKDDQELLDIHEDIFGEHNMRCAERLSERIFSMNKSCTDGLVEFCHQIMLSSVEILHDCGYEAPCEFSVIALGSVARGEATPYSDLEYGFIIESDKETEYFEDLAVDSYFRIGNLRETPIYRFNVSELENDQLPLSSTKCGFGIDGITDRAGNIPTGSESGNIGLLFTVEQLMELYKGALLAPPTKLVGDRSHILSTSVLIYSSGELGTALHHQFLKDRMEYETGEGQHHPSAKRKRFSALSSDIETYNFRPNFVPYGATQNVNIKVKTNIFRYPTLLLTNLKNSLLLVSDHPWDSCSKLHELHILTDDNYRYMKIVLALSIYIRTSAHVTLETNADLLSVYTSSAKYHTDRYYVPQNVFVTLCRLLVPIKSSIQSSLLNSYHMDNQEQSDMVSQIRSLVKDFGVSKTDFMLMANLLCYVGLFDSALNQLVSALGQHTVESCGKFIAAIRHQYNTTMPDTTEQHYVEVCCDILETTGRYKQAIDYMKVVMMYSDNRLVFPFWRLRIAVCLDKSEQYPPADKIVQEVFAYIKEMLGLDLDQSLPGYILDKLNGRSAIPKENLMIFDFAAITYSTFGSLSNHMWGIDQSASYYEVALGIKTGLMKKGVYSSMEYHQSILGLLSNLGNAFADMCDFGRSLAYHDECLSANRSLYGEYTNHPDIASAYNNIGSVFFTVGQYAEALSCFTQALTMQQAVFEKEDHAEIATSYSNLGLLHDDMGDYTDSLYYHTKSLEMNKRLHGDTKPNSDIADCHCAIGNVYQKMGKYTESLESHTKSLEIWLKIFGKEANRNIANCYSCIGNDHYFRGEYSTALICYSKSLNMNKQLPIEETYNLEIANCYSFMGHAHFQLNHYLIALECYRKGLAMYECVYKQEKAHPRIAALHCNMGSVYSRMGEQTGAADSYEKALDMYTIIYAEQPNHRNIATVCHNTATVYSDNNDFIKALEYLTKAIDIWQSASGEDKAHGNIASSYTSVGRLYHRSGKHLEALRYYTQAMENLGHVENADWPALLMKIAEALVELSEYKRAAQFLRIGLTKVPKHKQHYTIDSYRLLGKCYLHARLWYRSWNSHQSALTHCESLATTSDTEYSKAQVHLSLGYLLLHISQLVLSLHHSQLAVDITDGLVTNQEVATPEHTKLNCEARSLTNSLLLVKMCQQEFSAFSG